MLKSNHTPFNIFDNLNSAANKLFTIESMSRHLAEMRLAAGAEDGESVSELDVAMLQDGIAALARCALEEIERALEAHPAAPALHVVA